MPNYTKNNKLMTSVICHKQLLDCKSTEKKHKRDEVESAW